MYCYFAEDTVERNILDLAVKRGLSLYTKENCVGTLNLTSLVADASMNEEGSPNKKIRAQARKGDFIIRLV